MKQNVLTSIVVLFLFNCVSLGRVGYIVPDVDDLNKPTAKKAAETCDLLGVVTVIDKLNAELTIQDSSDLRNVNLTYRTKGCLTFNYLTEK